MLGEMLKSLDWPEPETPYDGQSRASQGGERLGGVVGTSFASILAASDVADVAPRAK
jgi:hypothetical protein